MGSTLVHVDCMCSEGKESAGENLTSQAEARVIAAIVDHLAGKSYHLAFHNGSDWARKTAEVVGVIAKFVSGLGEDRRFGFKWLKIQDFEEPREDVLARLSTLGEEATVAQCLERWQIAWSFWGRANTALQDVSRQAAALPGDTNERHVFVTSDKMVAELCTPEREAMPLLRQGDVVRHLLKVGDDGLATIRSSLYLPCPPVSG